MALAHCKSLKITNINYADCDGVYEVNTTVSLHWTKGTSANGRQLWWCGKELDDTAGKYSCTPFDTAKCGGSFGGGGVARP